MRQSTCVSGLQKLFFLASIFICIFHSPDPLLVPLAVNKEIIICCLSANCVCVCAYVCPDLKHFTIIGYKSLLKDVEEEYLNASVPPSNCSWTCPLMSRRESRRLTKSETGGAQSEEEENPSSMSLFLFINLFSFIFFIYLWPKMLFSACFLCKPPTFSPFIKDHPT